MADGPSEVLPDKGLVFAETEDLSLVLCKPKILPIKSFSLERLEKLEKKMQEEQKLRREREKAEKRAGGWSSGGVTAPALTVPARAVRPGPAIPLAGGAVPGAGVAARQGAVTENANDVGTSRGVRGTDSELEGNVPG